MHDIEPHWSWRDLYISSEDEHSPLFQCENSEFEFTNTVYNYYIHPQWDAFGSRTLYLKILFADYEQSYCILEFIGEWNDCIYNDIMYLKRNIIESLIHEGIRKFILIGENVLNFHASDDCYYQEWFEDVEEGWIAAVNFRKHVIKEFERGNIDYYIAFGGELNNLSWQNFSPMQMLEKIEGLMTKRLNP
ncbi:MAG: hypothetical protein V1904_15275 [Bacteroidota bacterium]